MILLPEIFWAQDPGGLVHILIGGLHSLCNKSTYVKEIFSANDKNKKVIMLIEMSTKI